MSDHTARVLRTVGEAVTRWRMTDDGDRVLACLSGGKDSWAMLRALLLLQRRAPVRFEVLALKVDYPHTPEQNERVAAYCREMGVDFTLVHTSIGQIIADNANDGKSHCAFCARLRRGYIYTHAEELGATRVALGHHREDFNETLLLNLFHQGRLLAMRPCYRPQGRSFDVIRPLALTPEQDIARLADSQDFPIVHHACPFADNTERDAAKRLLSQLGRQYPHLAGNLLSAQSNAGLLEPTTDDDCETP